MEYNGYDLFTDMEDADLQARNRAVVLWNIFESNAHNGGVDARGLSEMMGYIKHVPDEERAPALSKLRELKGAQAGNA